MYEVNGGCPGGKPVGMRATGYTYDALLLASQNATFFLREA